jgi:predicted ATPase/DNA-binding CsgD family transcriptional regulator
VAGSAIRSMPAWPAGLPAPLTPFVGRAGELTEIARLVTANRLVTLVGTGGVGKTRMAIEVAAGLQSRFADGLDLIDISTVTEPELVPAAVARALGVEDWTGAQLAERVVRVLRPQQRLVLLDNCEHVRDTCAALARELLAACPGVTILATSRVSLAVPGELTWRVPSLTFPWPDHQPALGDLESFEAAELFLARARAACPQLAIGPGDVPAIALICFRLDGIPLALELAAARAGALSLDDIASRLTSRSELLVRSGAGLARHQTLRASLEWSCQLLGTEELALLRRLAIFRGGWQLEAAEVICADPAVPAARIAALLAALVDHSLVQVEQRRPTRYRLLETIRSFATELLARSGEQESVRARHGRYFAELAEQSAAVMLGPQQAARARRLDAETENLRAARDWCGADPSRSVLGLRLVSGLWEYWQIRGRLKEGAEALTDALAVADGPPRARADALNGLGLIISLRGEVERGRPLLAEAAACYRQAGDVRGESRAWTHLGNTLAILGELPAAARAFARGLALARESGDIWYQAFALYLAGWAATAGGDLTAGVDQVSRSLPMFEQAGDGRAAGYALAALADCAVRDGRAEEAIGLLRRSLSVFEDLPDRWGLLYGMSLVLAAAAALGDWPLVATLSGIIDSLRERTGGQLFPHQVAVLEAAAAAAASALGPAMAARIAAGQAIGRSDAITAALWPPVRAARGAGGAAAPGTPGSGPGFALSPRELEVARLITGGLTNRQIGARLFIAERTVDTHVGRILAKLGCASRAQVAAMMAAAGPDSGGADPGGADPGGADSSGADSSGADSSGADAGAADYGPARPG